MRKGVKEARLAYRVISTREMEGQPRSAVQILLYTGRTHQIRVQFSSRKMPLIGDRRYGARDEDAPIGLWSFRLRFAHPITHVPLCFAAMPDFAPLRDGLPATADELPLLS